VTGINQIPNLLEFFPPKKGRKFGTLNIDAEIAYMSIKASIDFIIQLSLITNP
jgi:hypothetical protein